ncbi:hypothetical protein GGTG_07773 [Gaeumannomyces tritici R3-111a-1]|uniref:Uncharacterized protein n=1 Tax=Gaeumannomyces tritici (strain R3-111a-1) TaxID=644352 RepID=J3P2M7_GAET3|nr:hypothetical protein GGTG_07773 [Gaeumannomyces tritici R3-111a-1]EJT73919.1 hypothetical protein GGTG_07773 [Gaeumannomyces tritici R3-111a-1]
MDKLGGPHRSKSANCVSLHVPLLHTALACLPRARAKLGGLWQGRHMLDAQGRGDVDSLTQRAHAPDQRESPVANLVSPRDPRLLFSTALAKLRIGTLGHIFVIGWRKPFGAMTLSLPSASANMRRPQPVGRAHDRKEEENGGQRRDDGTEGSRRRDAHAPRPSRCFFGTTNNLAHTSLEPTVPQPGHGNTKYATADCTSRIEKWSRVRQLLTLLSGDGHAMADTQVGFRMSRSINLPCPCGKTKMEGADCKQRAFSPSTPPPVPLSAFPGVSRPDVGTRSDIDCLCKAFPKPAKGALADTNERMEGDEGRNKAAARRNTPASRGLLPLFP